MARSLAEEDPILKEHLVEAAIIEEEFVHAVEFAERFGLDHLLTEEVISSSGLPSQTDCLTLPVPANRVFFVDDLEGLARAQTEISASDLVGFDSEWKADSVRGAVPNPVALLQLATRGGAWLIDLLTLGQTSPKALESFLSSFLHNENILKLGFAVNGDLDRISKTHPAIRGALQNCGPLLDIAGLANLRGIRTRSLSGICEVCLGKPLSKRVRMSNWEERPLSEAQTQYAALDALCLIPLFDLLTKPDFQVPERNSVGQESVAAEGGIAASEEPGTAEASFRTGTAEDSAAEEVGGDKTLGRKEPEEVGFEGLSETNGAAFIETESGLSRGLDSGPASRLYREIDSESQKGLLTGIGGGETGSLAGGSGSSATAELLASENGAPGSFRPSLASPGETPPVDAVSVGSGDGRSVGGYGRKPQKRWQSLVYFYGARIDTGRGNKRREKRKGMATERLERTDPADPGTIGVSETGALGLGESRLAEENAEDGAEPAGQKPGAGAVAGEKTKASEKAQGTGQGDRWSGLGLPERVAEALQKGGVGPPQVLVCWEGEENVGGVGSDMKGGGTCRVDADETGGDLLMDAEVEVEEAAVAATAPDASVSLVEGESGFRPESMEMDGSGNGTGTEKETGTVSGDEEEETRALEAWRAAKRAAAGKHKIVLEKTGLETGIGEENGGVGGGDPDRVTGSEGEGSSGHVAGGEEGHVATRERPAWQVRCIPVLISGETQRRGV